MQVLIINNREFAFTIQEAIKDAAKSIPITSNKARPINPDEKSARGFIIQEEAYAILDRLYKTYLKGDSA